MLVGRRTRRVWHVARRRRTTGAVVSVEADAAWALAREERRGDVAGFYHTHPRGAGNTPSARDVRTMRAWCSSFGKPLLCVIADGRSLAAWVFDDARSAGRLARSVERYGPARWAIRDDGRTTA